MMSAKTEFVQLYQKIVLTWTLHAQSVHVISLPEIALNYHGMKAPIVMMGYNVHSMTNALLEYVRVTRTIASTIILALSMCVSKE